MTPPTAVRPRISAALSLAGAVAHPDFPSGDRAELRRWKPGTVPPVAYWRLAADRIPADLRSRDQDDHWALYVHALALLAPAGHERGAAIGRVLRDTGYHEARIKRLLNAPQGEDFRAELIRVVRWLAAHRASVDVTELADACRFGGSDPTREAIARAFFT